jgi:redox-sensitive bicupin YhaK (pirin superfamily)
MKYVLHEGSSRGLTEISWLKSYHTFSFGNYHNQQRMHFGALRVLNDDKIAPSCGFDTHSHANMEIISIPLEGSLLHRDSLGKKAIISKGEVQLMSAGTGISHSEYNNSATNNTDFLQLWIFPKELNSVSFYQQISFDLQRESNKLIQIVSPIKSDSCCLINQNAWLSIGSFKANNCFRYNLSNSENGVYLFVISGAFEWNNKIISERDGIGIWDVESIDLNALDEESEILIIEVPMEF